MPSDESKWVKLNVPDRFRMGPERIAERCGLRLRRDNGRLVVCTDERYRNSPPQLFHARRVADAQNAASEEAYAPFASWPPQDAHHSKEWRIKGEAEALRWLRSQNQEEWLYGWNLAVLTVPDAGFPRFAREAFTSTCQSLPQASLWAIDVDARFRWRAALVRVLFGALETPEVLNRSPEEFEGFPASRETTLNDLSLDHVISPAFVVTSPWVLGFSSARLGGVAALLFGQLLNGIHAGKPAGQMLDLFGPRLPPDQPPEPEQRPALQPQEMESFFRWWIARLNELFAVILDPARFATDDGQHEPRLQFAVLLSIERLFTTLQALMAAWHDEFYRRAMFFDILDILDGIRFADTKTLLTLSRAKAALERVKGAADQSIAPAIPKCEAAVVALDHVRQGFFLHERTSDQGLRVRDKHGNDVELSWENAVSSYLRVLRNSRHSFRDRITDPRARSLLAAHTGAIPAALPDLALLHVMDMMLHPTRLGCSSRR